MKRFIHIMIFSILAFVAGAVTVDEVPNVHVADRTRYVSNPDGVLSAEAVSRLDAQLASIWQSTSAEVVVVAIDEIDPSMTPAEFATALFEKWGVGKKDKDNGVIVLISRGDRKAVIRTGYGVEGALPDIIAGRIIRNVMAPDFRNGDYDAGTIAAVGAIGEVLANPELADELKSKYANDSRVSRGDDLTAGEFFNMFLGFAALIAVVMLIVVVVKIVSTRRLDDVQRYRSLDEIKTISLFGVFLTLGMGLIPYLILIWKMHRVRRHKRLCPNCQTRMELVDEEHDNDYLTPAQDTEEKLNSIDYDVWLCPTCATTEILPYINRGSSYSVCPRCGARAMSLVDRRTLVAPTVHREGQGVDIYACRNCGHQNQRPYKIARKPDPAAAAAAGAILGGLGRGSGGGGGFSGGSFGGGFTGGGGASGGW
ncbi:MAG: TPM domain-containing protein [Duncaniella sp.]|nr:TPM domain-containing protein [Duncaniella sp.]